MNRREFIKRAFAVGGLTALYSLGISDNEIKAAGLMQGVVGSASPSGGVTTYFGNNTDGTSTSSGWGNLTFANIDSYIQYTCPGSGVMDLVELGARASIASGSAHIRIAIYNDAKDTLIAQGSAEITISSSTAAWYTHTAFVDQAGSPISPTLTAGTDYTLAVTSDGAINWQYDAVTLGWAVFKSADYTGGYPAGLSDTSNSNGKICVRAGVQ